MTSVILETFQDQEFGTHGLGFADYINREGNNAATEGLLVAHDLIEHVNGIENIGSIDDELEALGAIWYVRGYFDDLRRDHKGIHTPHVNIASDITRMFGDFFNGGDVDLKPFKTMPLDCDEDFIKIIKIAKKEARKEYHDDSINPIHGLNKSLNDYIKICLPRMRRGYRKVRKRFPDATRVNSLFWNIAEAVETYTKNGEEYVGAQYELLYGFRSEGNAYAYCEEHYSHYC